MRMLEIATLSASVLLLVYALFAAQMLVPKKRLAQAVALNLLAGIVGAVAWEAWYGHVTWSCSALVITLAIMLTIWRHEAIVFVRCKLGDTPQPDAHPRRRASDLQEAASRR